MAKVSYYQSSPYSLTAQSSSYLSWWAPPAIGRSSTDNLITLSPRYTNRPDLLSSDLYGTPRLWWIFAMINPDTIRDPLFDFLPGVQIYVPSNISIQGYL